MKFTVKKLICFIVMLALVVGLIIGNVILYKNKGLIHEYFAKDTTDYNSENVVAALKNSDNTVQDIAEDSMVLLKNQNNTLPLKGDNLKVNLFGYAATNDGFLLSGGGSGGTSAHRDNKVTIYDAFEREGIAYNKQLLKAYTDYISYDMDIWDSDVCLINPGRKFYTDELVNQAKEYSDIAVVVLNRYGEENPTPDSEEEIPYTYQLKKTPSGNVKDTERHTLETSTEEDYMIDVVCENFETVIVLYNAGNIMELGFVEREEIDAAMFIGMPGQSGALSAVRLLKGKKTVEDAEGNKSEVQISPSGKLSDTYAYDFTKYVPSFVNATSRGTGNLLYAESVYIGYKWYETAYAEGYFDSITTEYGKGYDGVVQYPFGYGLSYTDFTWEVEEGIDPSVAVTDDSEFSVKVRVTNTGEHAGKDVVQLYYTPPYYEGEIEKSEINLLAFAKTELLQPGQSQLLELNFTSYDMASYDCYDKNTNGFMGYEMEEGSYQIKLMKDAHTAATCENATVTINAEYDIKFRRDPVTNTFVKNRFTGEMAYANMPIDGTTVYSGLTYMTRADFAGTFPQNHAGAPSDWAAVNTAKNYVYRGYAVDTAPVQGQAGNLRLVTRADGTFATYAELKGDQEAELKFNDELLTKLNDYDAPEWENLLNQLSQDDIKVLIGRGYYNIWAIESVGMIYRKSSDGPAGFNSWVSAEAESKKTAWPTASLIGNSWSEKTAYTYGRVIGIEGNELGLSGWTAPGVNLHRTPFTSRNYEYFSEDGILTGKLAGNIIRGAKNSNLYTFIKHWVASESGQNPADWNTWLTEQALRELYMKPFEIAVKEGGANGIMSCFSCIGPVWAGRNYALNQQILRGEWGFRGSMVTDWHLWYMDYTAGVLGGNDTWLNPQQETSSVSLDMNDPIIAYAARQSAKNVLYTWINTYVTARDFAASGSDDGFNVKLDIQITQQAFSPLFVFLWVLIDVVGFGGVAVWAILMILLDIRKNKKLKSA